MLEKEISLQETLTRGALYGTGSFEVSPEAACLRVPQLFRTSTPLARSNSL